MNWFELKNAAQVDSPALIIYKDRVIENINKVKGMIDNVSRLRPHVKTNKMTEVVQLMMGAGINKFKCATIAEAEMTGLAGAADVLLAYQPVGPKAVRFLELIQKYPGTQFSCLVDNRESANDLQELAKQSGRHVKVYMDINVGMNRTGIKPDHGALGLYQYVHSLENLLPVGFHVYDGHIHDTDLAIRKQKCDQAYEPVVNLVADVVASGLPVPLVVAGGTPTFPIHSQRRREECSPGTFVFWDFGYARNLPEQQFDYAALVLSRVISHIDDQLICLDLGHKSIAAENPQPRVEFLNIPGTVISQSEEHLVLKVASAADYPVGTVAYGVTLHICPTVALYEKAYVAENNDVTATWKVIARDRQIIV
ncbi:D-TA family PLP-dependent enzyme [Chitinophaga sp. sic0106]|uniref:D-TA family PLP-dependent enzyme n=1 Tax=Chitinophaga sp. sic0106 TaxID=2854785 RepID=UPI001C43D241|nr:D-TA family PLP-dependent enzyme [Chitinophaga sp. sic0106]MBV7533320.1 D-TA family PLP-dependent enzyme [Chitinophaga sp. sic0106]